MMPLNPNIHAAPGFAPAESNSCSVINLNTRYMRVRMTSTTVSVVLHILLLILLSDLLRNTPLPKLVPITVSLMQEIATAPIIEKVPEPPKHEPTPEIKKETPKLQRKVIKPVETPFPEPVFNDSALKTPVQPQPEPEQQTVKIQEAATHLTPAPELSEKPAPKEEKIEPPKFGVAYLNNPAPDYPPMSRRLGEEGRVLMRVLVSATGSPQSVEVDISSGFERLDEAAVEAVKKWRFIPAKKNNLPLDAYVLVPLRFSLGK